MKSLKCLILLIVLIYWSLPCFSQKKQYNDTFQIACHNCYEPHDDGSAIEDVFQYTTTIEIDIWDNEIFSGFPATIAGSHKLNEDWFVKHEPQQKGNLNCCGGTFKDCLNRVKNWGDINPKHEVVTVFIDKKENWSDPDEKRKPVDLDNLLLSIFTKGKIYAPSDLLNGKQNLKEAVVTNCPNSDSLKGKFIFVITDGTINTTGRKPLNEYLDAQKNNAICFVAPQISQEQEIIQPDGFSKENAKNIVFYNLACSSSGLAEKINLIKCLSRIFDCEEKKEVYDDLVAKKINFVAMHNYKLK